MKRVFPFLIPLLALVSSCSQQAVVSEHPLIHSGRSLYDHSRFKEAEETFMRVLVLSDSTNDGVLHGQALKWLGNIQLAYRRDAEALKLYRQSAVILDSMALEFEREKGSIPNLVQDERHNVLNNIAVIHLNRDEFEKADSIYAGLLEYDRMRRDKLPIAVTLYNMGIVQSRIAETAYRLGDKQGFTSHLEKGRERFLQSLSTYPTADAYLNLGNTYAHKQAYDSAITCFQRAESIYATSGYRVHQAMCLGNMGALLYRLKDLPRATEALRKAIAIVEELRGDLSSIDVRSSFVSNKYYLYENLIGLLIDQNNPQEALMYVERAKSRSFLDMLGNKAIGESKQRTPQAQALIDEEKTLQERMSDLIDNPDSADALALVIARHQQVLGELTRLDPEYASVKSIDPMPVKDLQMLLPDSSALVEYYLGDESSFVFVLKRDTLVVRKLRIDPAFGLDSRIEQLRRKLYSGFSAAKSALISEKRLRDRMSAEDAKAAWYNTTTDASWQYDLVAMYSILIAPIQELLAGMNKLYIVPHGPLHHLPFQALVAPAGIDKRRDVHVARPHYFIEDHAIAYLPSASVLQFARSRNQGKTVSALVVGDPLYADPVYRKRPLAGALIEADSVASYFSGPTVLKREAATEQAVKEVVGSSRVVHFATHGELNKRDPLKSRILLAAPSPAVPNDGNLTVGEVFNLDLHASLVTLSACQTAQVAGGDGKFTPGDDLVGLTRSFLYAGTPSVIASLWYVDDAATLAWMTCYYRSWTTAGMRRVEAAREAALEMLRHPGDPDWVFPYFWGAFIYFGAMEQH